MRAKPSWRRPQGYKRCCRARVRRTESDDQLLAETDLTFDLLYEAYSDAPGKT